MFVRTIRQELNGITRLPNFPRRVADQSRDRTIESRTSHVIEQS